MVDFSTLNLREQGEAGFTLQVVDPTNYSDLPGVTVRIRSDKSKTVESFERNRLKDLQKREKMLSGKNKSTDFTPEELDDMIAKGAAVRIMGWTGIQEEGENLEYSPENAEYLVRKYTWLGEQVRDASKDLENFRPKVD